MAQASKRLRRERKLKRQASVIARAFNKTEQTQALLQQMQRMLQQMSATEFGLRTALMAVLKQIDSEAGGNAIELSKATQDWVKDNFKKYNVTTTKLGPDGDLLLSLDKAIVESKEDSVDGRTAEQHDVDQAGEPATSVDAGAPGSEAPSVASPELPD